MKIFLFGQRNNLGVERIFGGFVDAMKSLAAIGELVEEVRFQEKSALLLVTLNKKTCQFFSSQHCLNSLSKEP